MKITGNSADLLTLLYSTVVPQGTLTATVTAMTSMIMTEASMTRPAYHCSVTEFDIPFGIFAGSRHGKTPVSSSTNFGELREQTARKGIEDFLLDS